MALAGRAASFNGEEAMSNTQPKRASTNCFTDAIDAQIVALAAMAFRLGEPERLKIATAHLPQPTVNGALDRLVARAVNGA
jgi:hypothetical protein